MSGGRDEQSHPIMGHTFRCVVRGDTAAEVEGEACRLAGEFFGLLPGDVIPDWLTFNVHTEATIQRNVNGEIMVMAFIADVTARRNESKWAKWLEEL